MKKIKHLLLVVLTFVIGLFCLVACGGESVAGTYKFVSQSTTMNGETVEFKVGDEDGPYGVITEDFLVIELKEDGSFVQTVASGTENQTFEGTWTQDGNTISLTYQGSTQNGTLDGDTLTLSSTQGEYSATMILKKAS